MNDNKNDYVLVTAAYNEEDCIEKTILSVVKQTLLPKKWVIVSDGSTDKTDIIVKKFSKRYDFLIFLRRDGEKEAGFVSKVAAIHLGYNYIKQLRFNYIGHLDADISLDENYYENIIEHLNNNKKLGIAGGFIYEERDARFQSRSLNVPWSVAGGIQMFRRRCYEAIGGLLPLKHGGEDWHAEVAARMEGWQVKAFPEIIAYHHKTSATKRGLIAESLRQGAMDYMLGTHPVFEIVKCFRRVKQKPYIVFSMLRFAGYVKQYLEGAERPVSREFVLFLRREQLERLNKYFSNAKKYLIPIKTIKTKWD